MDIIQFFQFHIHCWKMTFSHLSGTWRSSGGHMAGIGNGFELLICYGSVGIQILLAIIIGLIIGLIIALV